LGLDKTLPVWKEAKSLQPALQEVTKSLEAAVSEGDASALNLALSRSKEMKLAEHSTALTQAKLYQKQLIELESLVDTALTKRRYTALCQVLKRSEDLQQTDDAQVIDCQSLHAEFKKIDDAIRVAFANSDDPELDKAIIAAHDANCETRVLTQALFRVGEDIRMELVHVVKSVKSGKKSKKNYQKLIKNLSRTEKLQIKEDNEIFAIARDVKNVLAHEEKVADQLRNAYENKDEEKIKEGVKELEKLDPIDEKLELLQKCQDYLDRLPADKKNMKRKHPLQFATQTGYMDKRGQGFPYNWRTRFFALDRDLIKYYESAQSRLPKGSLMIQSIDHMDIEATKKNKKIKDGFPFIIKGNTRLIQCSTKNESERKKWVDQVNTNLTMRRKLDRLQMIFDSVAPKGEVNIHTLSVIAKLAYCPSVDEKEQLIASLERDFPNGNVKLKECTPLVRSINPVEPQDINEAWRNAIQLYSKTLIGKNPHTASLEEAMLLSFALFIPQKAVLERFRKYFREKDRGKVTYFSLIYGLQRPQNSSLCYQLNLDCDVPRCTLESKGLSRKALSSAMFASPSQRKKDIVRPSVRKKQLKPKESGQSFRIQANPKSCCN